MAIYCTKEDVRRILLINDVNAETVPTADQVDDFIEEAEDEIDSRTGHAWRTVAVSNQFYSVDKNASYYHGAGLKIFLRKRDIIEITSLQVWNSSSYEDWVTTKTEGRASDFWVDNEMGILYMRKWTRSILERQLKISYTYGSATVPKDIRQATALTAAALILNSEDRTVKFTDTGDQDSTSYDARSERLQNKADKLILNRAEIMVI